MKPTTHHRAVAKQTTSDLLFNSWRTWILDDSVCRAMADSLAGRSYSYSVDHVTPDQQGAIYDAYPKNSLTVDPETVKKLYAKIREVAASLKASENWRLVLQDYMNGAASALNFYPMEGTSTYCMSDSLALRSDFLKIATDFSNVWTIYLQGLEDAEVSGEHKRDQQERRKPERVASR